MSTIGRNNPCPCGSKKKYKRCCGQIDATDPYVHVRDLECVAVSAIMQHFVSSHGKQAVEEAWREFICADDVTMGPDEPSFPLFESWLLYDSRPDGNDPAARLYLDQVADELDHSVRRFIESVLESPYSFYQVLAAVSGKSILLRDVLRERKTEVMEKTASQLVRPGDVLYARVVNVPELSFLVGTGGTILRPTQLNRILSLRAAISTGLRIDESALSTSHLLQIEEHLRIAYFSLEATLYEIPQLNNTDGEMIEFNTLTFEVSSFDAAFEKLKSLELRATRQGEGALLARGRLDKAGRPIEVTIHWLKKVKDNETVIATLRLKRKKLVVEVNSERRAQRAKKEVMKRLGENAVFLRQEVQSQESVMRKLDSQKQKGPLPVESEHDRVMREFPEAREAVRSTLQRHWSAWPDRPIPALDGMTPREAARSPRGRELLQALLWEFEQHNRQSDGIDRVDLSALAREIGMPYRPSDADA